jgi:YaiO family outer membrane protein
MKLKAFIITILTLFVWSKSSYAQKDLDSDELFKMARDMAFEKKDYPKAIELCQQALVKSPNYEDIRVFLGRIYIWNDKLDDARKELNQVLKLNPKNKEAISSFIDLEYWNDNSLEALEYCNKGLGFYPNDEELSIKKGKVLNDLKRFDEALKLINQVIERYPQNTDARTLAARIRDNASQSFLTLSYDYFYFDKNYNSSLHESPWHLASLAYSRGTKYGTVIGRITYANRFGDNGYQAEIDAYPRISKTFYSYVNLGYSADSPVFPKFRNGFSLYANLPKSFEGEVGYRYLKFTDATWIYTTSVGKYIGNYWFNLRAFFVPGESDFSQSYTLTTRYYFGGSFDFLSIGIGTGISPDESRNVLLDGQKKLNSVKANFTYSRVIKERNILSFNASWFNEQQSGKPNGNQLDAGFSFRRQF